MDLILQLLDFPREHLIIFFVEVKLVHFLVQIGDL